MAELKESSDPATRLYEADDADILKIALSGGGLLLLLAVVMVLMSWMAAYLGERQLRPGVTASPLAGREQLPPPPRLQIQPIQDLGRMRAEEDEMLNSYAWVDRQAGVVRIPVDRAIDLVAQRGLPARPAEKKTTEAQRTQRPE